MNPRLALLFCLLPLTLHASQTAVTDEGDIVILNDDGTWLFENPDTVESVEIPVNEQVFRKPANSRFRLKSTNNESAVWLDAKKWAFEKGQDSGSNEYSFSFKNGDLYGLLITEAVQTELEALSDIALQNALSVAPNARIVKREYRVVNGNKLIYMETLGTISSIKFKYMGYYFSDETGSTQFIAYTGENLVKRYETDIQDFLNGLATQ